jgi:TPR repeat protein
VYEEKFKKLIKDNMHDPRLARWFIFLGLTYLHPAINNGEQKAKESYLRAGDLGLGEGYRRLAEIYVKYGDKAVAMQYYHKAAERLDPVAITALGLEAEQRQDYQEAFRRFRQAASLGHPYACTRLGFCFISGKGTDTNYDKGFKWALCGALKGSKR